MSIFDNKRAALFDLGGTLIEFETRPWEELERDAMARCHSFLSDRGFDIPSAEELAGDFTLFHAAKRLEIKTHNREVVFDLRCAEFLSGYSIDLGSMIAEFSRRFYEPISEQLKSIDGNADLLRFVKKKGMRIGLVSNSPFPASWHRDEMKRFGILEFFDYTVFSSDIGLRKPHHAIFRECLKALGASAQDAVHIGDRPTEDVAGANGMGITSVLIRRADRTLPDGVKPSLIVDDLRDLMDQ
jgi:HAD superfamily hydrolase (TIGR01549 family)